MEKEIFGFELDNRGLFKYQSKLLHLLWNLLPGISLGLK